MIQIQSLSKGYSGSGFLLLLSLYICLHSSRADDKLEMLNIYDEEFTPQKTIVFANDTFFFPQGFNDSKVQSYKQALDALRAEQSGNKVLRGDHPVLSIDTFCLFINVDSSSNNCELKDTFVQFFADFTYTSSYNLLFSNAKYRCYKLDGTYCKIYFSMGSKANLFSLRDGSTLIGDQIAITGGGNVTVRIDNTSFINVSATSDFQGGTQYQQGASYLSEGGNCLTVLRKTYGYYNLLTNISSPLNSVNKTGSQGVKGDEYTNGGGRIVIIVDNLRLEGPGERLIASGGPFRTNQKSKNTNTYYGGSGGYIYIETAQKFAKNSIQTGARITADGGHGKGQGYGGAGGLIQFKNLLIDASYVSASPGQVLDNNNSIIPTNDTTICKNGGPGMVYFVDLDLLSINPQSTPTTKKVYLIAQSNKVTQLSQLEMKNYTRIILQNTQDFIIKSQLRTFWNSSISTEFPSDSLNINIGFSNFIDPQTYLNFASIGKVSITTNSITPMELSLIKFRTSLDITAGSLIINQDSLKPQAYSSLSYINLRCIYDLNFTTPQMKLSAPKITLMGNRSMNFAPDMTISTSLLTSPNPKIALSEEFSVSKAHPMLGDTIKQIPTADKYDLFLYTNSRINFRTANITSQMFGVRCLNFTAYGIDLTASSQVSSQGTPILIYSTNSVVNYGPTSFKGKRVWISGQNLILQDSLSITNSLVDKTSSGGSQQSDYHIAIAMDKEIRALAPLSLQGSSILLQSGTNMTLTSPKLVTVNSNIQPSIQIQSGGVMNFTNLEKGSIDLLSAGQVVINSNQSIVKSYYGLMSIKSDNPNIVLTFEYRSSSNEIQMGQKNSKIQLQQQQSNSQTIQITAGARITPASNIGISLSQLSVEGQSLYMSSLGDLSVNSFSASLKDTKPLVIQSNAGAVRIYNNNSLSAQAIRIYAAQNITLTGTYAFSQLLSCPSDTQMTSQNGSINLQYLTLKANQVALSSQSLLQIQDSIVNVGASSSSSRKISFISQNDSVVLNNLNTQSDSFNVQALGGDANYTKVQIPTASFTSLAANGSKFIDSTITPKLDSISVGSTLSDLNPRVLQQGGQIPYKQQTINIQTQQNDLTFNNTKITSASIYLNSLGSLSIIDSSINVTDKAKETVLLALTSIKLLEQINVTCQTLTMFAQRDIQLDSSNSGQVQTPQNQSLQVLSAISVTSLHGLIRVYGLSASTQTINLNTSFAVNIQKSYFNITSKSNQNIQPSLLVGVNESASITDSVIQSTNVFISTQINNLVISSTNISADRNLYIGAGDYLKIINSQIIEGTLTLSQSPQLQSSKLRLEQSTGSQNLQLDSGDSGMLCANSTLNGNQIFLTSQGDFVFQDKMLVRVQDQSKDIQFISKGGLKVQGAFDLKAPSLKVNCQKSIILNGIGQLLNITNDISLNSGPGMITVTNFNISAQSLNVIGLSSAFIANTTAVTTSFTSKNVIALQVNSNVTLSQVTLLGFSITIQVNDNGFIDIDKTNLTSTTQALSLSSQDYLSVKDSYLSTTQTMTLYSQNSFLNVLNSNLLNKNLNLTSLLDLSLVYDNYQSFSNNMNSIVSTQGSISVQNLSLSASNLTIVAGGGSATLNNLYLNLSTPYQVNNIDQLNNFSVTSNSSTTITNLSLNSSNAQFNSGSSLSLDTVALNLTSPSSKSNNKAKESTSTIILLANEDVILTSAQVSSNQIQITGGQGLLNATNSKFLPQEIASTQTIFNVTQASNSTNLNRIEVRHYLIKIQSGSNLTIQDSTILSSSYSIASSGAYTKKYNQFGYQLDISSKDSMTIASQQPIQSYNASITSGGGLHISGDIQVIQQVSDKQNQPATLNISAESDIAITSSFTTDKVSVRSNAGSITHNFGQVISNTNSTPPSPGNKLQIQDPDPFIYDVAYLADTSLSFLNLRISHYAGYFSSGAQMQMNSSYILSNMYGSNYPGTYIRAGDTIAMTNIDIFSDQLDAQSSQSISFYGISNKVSAYQLDYKWGQDSYREVENQLRIVATEELLLQSMTIQSYNSYFEGSNIQVLNSKAIRYSEADTNQIALNASANLTISNLQSISAKAFFMGNQSISIHDLDITVFSSSQSLYLKKRYDYYFKIVSLNGPITIGSTSQNSYITRDVLIQCMSENDIAIQEPLQIEMTDFENSPDPSIKISTKGSLIFGKSLSLRGGTMLLQGKKGITFSDQVQIDNQWMYHNFTEKLTHTFQLQSDGNISALIPFNIAAMNVKIQGDDLNFDNLKILTSDYVSVQPGIYFDALGKMSIQNAQIAGGVLQLDGHDEVRVSQSNLTCLVPDNSSFSYEDGIFINSKGDVIMERGQFSGLNIKVSGNNTYFGFSSITATRLATSNNIQLYANNYLEGNQFILRGGQMIFIGPNGILFDSQTTNTIESDPSLIILKDSNVHSSFRLAQSSKPHQEAISFISTKQIQMKSKFQSHIYGPSIKIESDQVDLQNLLIQEKSPSYDFQETLIEIEGRSNLSLSKNVQIYGQQLILMSSGVIQTQNDITLALKNQDDSLLSEIPIRIDGLKGVVQMSDTKVLTKKELVVNSTDIQLANATIDVKDFVNQTGKSQQVSNLRLRANKTIQLDQNTVINARKVFLSATQSISVSQDSSINIVEENTCNMDESDSSDLFTCVPRVSLDRTIDENEFIQRYSTRYQQKNVTQIYQTYDLINSNFSAYLFSAGQISISQSAIKSPRIGLCSTTIKLSQNTVLDASKRGCLSDQGLGSGVKFDGCAATGASFGGDGGPGAHLLDSQNQLIKCYQNHPNSYGFSTADMRFEGSGGGSSLKGAESGGNGGGIVWVTSADSLTISDSQILASGGNGIDNGSGIGSGGGSGGSIFMLQSLLSGNGLISVRGGDGSINGGGQGAGGRVMIYYLGNYLSDFYSKRSINWLGTLDVSCGQRGELGPRMEWDSEGEDMLSETNGTVWHAKCPPGHSGGFCEPCPAGTFKYGYSYGKCVPCQNKPDNAFYSNIAVTTANCPYQCSPGFDSQDKNPNCLEPFEFQIYRLGNQYMAFVVLIFILTLTFLQWICLIRKQKDKRNQASQKKMNVYVVLDHEEEILSTQTNQDQDVDLNQGLLGNQKDRIPNVEFKEKDLWYHSHRLYLMGLNSIKFPWILSKDQKPGFLSEQDQNKFDQMILEHRDSLSWPWYQRISFVILKVTFPNLASYFHKCLRKRKYHKLKRILIDTFDRDFWNDQSVNKSIRVSCSEENYNVAQFDFIDYTKSFLNYTGPQLPMIMLISGTGSFNNPYHVDFNNDPYVKSILLLNKKQLKPKLPMYLENLDSLIRRLSFYNLTGQILKDLNTLLEHIDFGNKHLFYPINVKLTLHIFENKKHRDGRQSRHSFPIDSKFFALFPSTFKTLMKYVKLRLFQRKSEIKFGLAFTKLDEQKTQRINERINTFIQRRETVDDKLRRSTQAENDENDQMIAAKQSSTSSNNPMNFSIQREDTMMFADCLEDDYGEEFDALDDVKDQNFEQRFKESIEAKPQGDIQREDSIVTYDESRPSAVSMGRSQRAFTLSKNSTKSLELSMEKDRNKLKHKCLRMWSILYSVHRILFQLSAKPPAKHHYILYLIISLLIATDAFVGFLFLVHLINPIDNIMSFGFIYYLVYPLMPILSPIVGLLSTLCGSSRLMRQYSKINALLSLANYPITIIAQLAFGDDLFYVAMVIVLLLLKAIISFVAARVRADLENPHFHKNRITLKRMTKEKKEKLRQSMLKKSLKEQRKSHRAAQGLDVNISDSSDESFEFSSDEDNKPQLNNHKKK